jgi:hypothetical protein
MGVAGRQKRPLDEIAIVDQTTIDAIAAQIPQGGYTHPSTHPASMIVEDTNSQFITMAQKTDLTDGGETTLHTHAGSGLTLTQVKADTDIASAISLKHASGSDNQNLGDITKEQIEAKLIGTITSHSHASSGGLTQEQILRLI